MWAEFFSVEKIEYEKLRKFQNLKKFSGNLGWMNMYLEEEYKGTKTPE